MRARTLVPLIRKLRLAAGETPGKFAQQVARRSARVSRRARQRSPRRSIGWRRELRRVAERSEDVARASRGAREAAADGLARWQRRAARRRRRRRTTWIRWVDVGAAGLAAACVAAVGAPTCSAARSTRPGRAWIFTSATLAVGRDFSHYTRAARPRRRGDRLLGQPVRLSDAGAAVRAARPAAAEHASSTPNAVVDAALPVLKASGGRAFLLFTTLRALNAARERLADAFEREGLDYPLLVQGDGSKTELLVRFRALGNAVLLGSASFWEGVDVPGDALSVVVIDKLPFAPPDDPLLAARLARLEAEGGNAFMDWQLPQAAISLKQGAGRLIRTETDRGVLMICDPRLDRQALRPADLAEPAADEAHARARRRHRVLRSDSSRRRRLSRAQYARC